MEKLVFPGPKQYNQVCCLTGKGTSPYVRTCVLPGVTDVYCRIFAALVKGRICHAESQAKVKHCK